MDKALKQRLVGAIVLIALAVIVLPMIFGGRPSPGGPETRDIELPTAPPDLEFETRRFPVGDEGGLGSGPGLRRDGDVDSGGEGAEPMTPLPEPGSPVQDVAGEPEQPATAVEPPEAEGGAADESRQEPVADSMDALVAGLLAANDDSNELRYVVQVASFGSNENAVRLAGELEQAGYAVLLDHVSGETGDLNRVRVGPYATEAEAQEVVGAMQQRFSDLNPRIVDMQPEKAAPAIAGEDPLVRWVVQVGSFSNEGNAKQLVSRLRASGLGAYDEAVSSDTSTIYRVRVGPYLDRAEALSAEEKIAAETGIDPVVMTAE